MIALHPIAQIERMLTDSVVLGPSKEFQFPTHIQSQHFRIQCKSISRPHDDTLFITIRTTISLFRQNVPYIMTYNIILHHTLCENPNYSVMQIQYCFPGYKTGLRHFTKRVYHTRGGFRLYGTGLGYMARV